MFMATIGYPRIKEIIEQDVASGLIYLNSHARRLQDPRDPAATSTSTSAAPNGIDAVDASSS